MEQSIHSQLSEITQALDAGTVTGRQAGDCLAGCVDALVHLEDEPEEVLPACLPVLDRLIARLPKGSSDAPYYRSVVALIRGDRREYLAQTELFYAARSARSSRWLDWFNADRYFVSILSTLPVLDDLDDKAVERLIRVHQKYAAEYCPASAFDLYCRFWLSNATPRRRLGLLREVLEKDPKWARAWVEMGDIYYDQGDFAQALDAYRHAMADQRSHSADLFFSAAWAADLLKDPEASMGYYRRCIDLDPAYPYAQNNLGWFLNRQKQYDQAEPYLRYALEHDPDIKNACRNLFTSLEKQGKTQALFELVRRHPEQFQTKYYRERLELLGQQELSPDDLEKLKKELEKTTTNDFAGTINVSPDPSGIRLYPHQAQAIQSLDRWEHSGSSGAGLLVLPTGGGKTLTATYWLMRSILDKGGKVLWIAHRHELLDQAHHAFERVCYQDLSPHAQSYRYRILSGRHDKSVHIRPEDDILIASKSSLAHDLSHIRKKWIEPNKNRICMVIDEAHHAPASEYRKLIGVLRESGGDFRLLGLTATPFRTAEKEQGLLSKIFPDDILYKTDLRTLIEQGILAEPIFHPIDTKIKMADWFRAENADALLERIATERGFDLDSPGALGEQAARLIAAHSERNRLIVDTYANNREMYGKTLVFAVNVDMAIALNHLFQSRGIRSAYVVSSLRDAVTGVSLSNEENAVILRQFREGELDVLVNVNILTEGTDLPQVQTVFLTRPTKSTILMTQMIGRALRGERAGGTAKAYIVSFLDDWQEHIAWVNPEKLFLDTNADFTQASQRRAYVTRLVSIAKLEEFAQLADDSLDDRVVEQFSFLERIPVGLYQFSYLPDGEEESRSCTVLVYDCMQEAYRQLMEWMERADLSDLDAAVAHVDETLFGEADRLLGYHPGDVRDILAFYRQTGAKPQWIALEERAQYDVVELAQHILDSRLDALATDGYLKDEWNQASGKWSAFFGYQNYKAFRKAVRQECDRLIDGPEPPRAAPITKREEIQIQDLTLEEIRRRFPEIGKKLRNAVYARFRDEQGYFFSAKSGFRSKNPLDFQVDHIKPMSKGGKTTLDNLRLLTCKENGERGDTLESGDIS